MISPKRLDIEPQYPAVTSYQLVVCIIPYFQGGCTRGELVITWTHPSLCIMLVLAVTTNLPNRSLRKFRIPICISDHCLDVTSYKTVQVILWQLNCNNEYPVGSKYLFWKEWLMYVKVNFCYSLQSRCATEAG